MTQDSTGVYNEEQKVLLAMTRTMDSSFLKWDDSVQWHGGDGDNIRDKASAYLLRRCIHETGIKFQAKAARVAIEVNDAELLKQILPRLDISYSTSEEIVSKAVTSHNAQFYYIIREFWKSIEPDMANEDREYIRKTYHLHFCDALSIALKSGTPEVFDAVYGEFNDGNGLNLMIAVKASNWALVGHILSNHLVLPGMLAEVANALRVAKQDALVQKAMSLGFKPSIDRDPYENIIDMVHEDDFQKMLQSVDKILSLPREAAYRLVRSGEYDRIEAVLKVQSSVTKQALNQEQFMLGLHYMLVKLREQGKYKDLTELFRLFKAYPKLSTYGSGCGYSIDSYVSSAVAHSDINALEIYFNAGLEFHGSITVNTPPQPASRTLVQYLITNGHHDLAGSAIMEFLDFDLSDGKDAREQFYFKCIEDNLISDETFGCILHRNSYHLPLSIVEHIVLTERIKEPAANILLRVWPGYMSPKLMEYFLSKDKEETFKHIKWEDWGKYYTKNGKVEVMKLLIASGYEVSSTERAAATKSKNEAMIALLSKKSRKNKKE